MSTLLRLAGNMAAEMTMGRGGWRWWCRERRRKGGWESGGPTSGREGVGAEAL